MKRILSFLLAVAICISVAATYAFASDDVVNDDIETNIGAEITDVDVEGLDVKAKSALLMEASTGRIIYAKNVNEALAPASVTKIMTLLLVAEAISNGSIKPEDTVTVSANATSMGGSQVFLKEGEEFTVEELLKCTMIASANDAAVALAEHIAGTEEHFVARMNERAKELGMKDTCFENTTGLDDTTTKHVTSAYDIALMTRELLKHDIILKYSGVWQSDIRNGEFILTNTNRLVRYYRGCTGLKTGSTDKAGFCISATAERDGMHLIAVIMGADTRDDRNNAARALLDYGFSAYCLYDDPAGAIDRLRVKRGTLDDVSVYSSGFTTLVPKAEISKIEKEYVLPEYVEGAHIEGECIGKIKYFLNGEEIGACDVVLHDSIEELGVFKLFLRILVNSLT